MVQVALQPHLLFNSRPTSITTGDGKLETFLLNDHHFKQTLASPKEIFKPYWFCILQSLGFYTMAQFQYTNLPETGDRLGLLVNETGVAALSLCKICHGAFVERDEKECKTSQISITLTQMEMSAISGCRICARLLRAYDSKTRSEIQKEEAEISKALEGEEASSYVAFTIFDPIDQVYAKMKFGNSTRPEESVGLNLFKRQTVSFSIDRSKKKN